MAHAPLATEEAPPPSSDLSDVVPDRRRAPVLLDLSALFLRLLEPLLLLFTGIMCQLAMGDRIG